MPKSSKIKFELGMDRLNSDDVACVFREYPEDIRVKLMCLRRLIFETASEIEGIYALQETLKWGDPSYLMKGGSTVRVGWKSSTPHQYAIYFNCNTKLVATFREL